MEAEMVKSRSIRLVTWSLIWFVLLGSIAQGQSDWEAVLALAAGTELRIQHRANQSVDGRIETVDETGITILLKNKPAFIPRNSIRSIKQRDHSTATRNAGIGALVGAAGGLLQGYTLAESNKGTFAIGLAAGWAAIGALIGAIHGASHRQEVLVYEAP
jgi:hypothetical protein